MARVVELTLKDPNELYGGKDVFEVYTIPPLPSPTPKIPTKSKKCPECAWQPTKFTPDGHAPMCSKKVTTCSNCGWKSGGDFGPNQHDVTCAHKAGLVVEQKLEIDGPFTSQSVLTLCKEIDAKMNDGKGGGYSYSKTPQDVLDFFNHAWKSGGFESMQSWWEGEKGGFNVIWGSGRFGKWKDEDEPYPACLALFEGFQEFIQVNQPAKSGVSTRKTQKARGIEKLRMFTWGLDLHVLPHLFVSNEQVRLISKEKLPEKDAMELWRSVFACSNLKKGERLTFARCCPLTPRHGFTDSVFVPIETTYTAFMKRLAPLCIQMLKDDPQAELILMQPCFAHFNIVTNEKAIVVGAGHDGATGGKDTFTFPVSKPFEFTAIEKAKIGVAEESGVFSECVGRMQKGKRYSNSVYDVAGAGASGGIRVIQTYLTQLRGGPKIDVTGDFVPREICLDQDYLIPHKNPETGEEYKDTEWEKVINDVKAKDDWEKYFVYHPGGSIASHFGVHCYINEIPYITSNIRFNKKATLKPNATIKKADLEAFQRGFRKAPNLLHLITPAMGVEILLAALHNYPAMDASDPKQAEFLGFAVEFAIHLGLSTCLGESRYADRVKMDFIRTKSQGSREFVYYRAQMFDLNYVLRKAHLRCPWFGIPNWGGGSGVGGLKWLECSEAVFELWNAVCALVQDGGKDALGLVVSQLNKVVNICHNAARMLTKFTGNPTFDFAVAHPHRAAFKVAPILFELLRANVSEKPIQFEQFDLPKKKWDAELIRAERLKLEKARRVNDSKTPHMKCPKCNLWIDLEPYHMKSCSAKGKGVLPFKALCEIKEAPGYNQCQTCGWYTEEHKLTLGHCVKCPVKLKTVASEALNESETDDKCDDESCSSCYPNKLGKE